MSVRAFRNFRGFPSLCCTPCTSPSRYSSTSEIFQLFSHKTRNRFQVLDTTAMTFYGCQGICCWGNRQRFVNNQPVLAPPPGTSFHPIHALHGRLNDSPDFAQAHLTLQDTPAAAMHRYTAGTPCPAPSNASYPSSGYYDYGHAQSNYPPSYMEDGTTANIEFTTEIQPRTRTVKPRRPARPGSDAAPRGRP